MEKFSQILKELRKQKNLTQEELGKIINVTKVSISGYEKGNRIPDIETLISIADYFNVSLDFLVGRSDTYDDNLDKLDLINKLSELEKEVLFNILKRLP